MYPAAAICVMSAAVSRWTSCRPSRLHTAACSPLPAPHREPRPGHRRRGRGPAGGGPRRRPAAAWRCRPRTPSCRRPAPARHRCPGRRPCPQLGHDVRAEQAAAGDAHHRAVSGSDDGTVAVSFSMKSNAVRWQPTVWPIAWASALAACNSETRMTSSSRCRRRLWRSWAASAWSVRPRRRPSGGGHPRRRRPGSEDGVQHLLRAHRTLPTPRQG